MVDWNPFSIRCVCPEPSPTIVFAQKQHGMFGCNNVFVLPFRQHEQGFFSLATPLLGKCALAPSSSVKNVGKTWCCFRCVIEAIRVIPSTGIGTGFASVKSNLFLGHSEAHWAIWGLSCVSHIQNDVLLI